MIVSIECLNLIPCKFPSVCQHLVAESTFVLRLVFVVWSVVLSWSLSGHPRPSLFGHRCTVVSLLGPPECHIVQGDSVAKRQPLLCVLVGVVTSCVLCARVRGRASRSWQLRVLTLLLGWKRCSSSQSSPLSGIRVRSNISAGFGCSVQLVVLFDTFFISFEFFLLVVGSVAIRLVHANTNLFLPRYSDQFRMLSRLSLDITAIFPTGYTLYFMSMVL